MNNEFELAIKDFVRNGGVVLAANHNANIVGVKGDMNKVDEYLIKALLGISVSVIKNNPKAFEVMAAATVVHLWSAVKIAEQNYNVPNLAKDVMYRIVGALTDEDITYMTTLSAKRMLEDIEKSGKVGKIEK
ncbi:hypothetical protein [Phascolarctobacterium succinatutens]|jgi:hypothetical protein|nr:MAG: hypothetical protein [Bacteriophage sp.]DAG53661.1 MAG TPA: hypothetical protein [Caudoviricetes sp.]DAP17609.1 MAG TPA: hypothetical protein [Caudoviricetes sp.]